MKINISADAGLGSLSNRYTTVKTQTLDLRFSQGFSLLKSRNEKLNSYWGYSIQANPSFIKQPIKMKQGIAGLRLTTCPYINH